MNSKLEETKIEKDKQGKVFIINYSYIDDQFQITL